MGRLGRHLLAQADAEQLIDFPDKVSGQELSTAMANLTTWLRANPNAPLTSVPPQPFFEHVLYPNGTGISPTRPLLRKTWPRIRRAATWQTVST